MIECGNLNFWAELKTQHCVLLNLLRSNVGYHPLSGLSY
jgi:hypothetical protein